MNEIQTYKMETKTFEEYIDELNKLGKGSKLGKLRMAKTEDIRVLFQMCIAQENFEICECINIALKERNLNF